jgi:hypothetical protein
MAFQGRHGCQPPWFRAYPAFFALLGDHFFAVQLSVICLVVIV